MNASPAPVAASAYSRTNPFPAKLVENFRLSKEGSEKETRHMVVDISGSGLTYKVGDSLGIFPRNSPRVVEELLRLLNLSGDAALAEKLSRELTLNRASKKFVKLVAEKMSEGSAKEKLQGIIASEEALTEYVYTRDPVDVLREFLAPLSVEELTGALTKIAPRLYSIASSPLMHPTHVHLTVAIVRYETHERAKAGLATGFLADVARLNEPDVPTFVQPAKHFHLPADSTTPIIMIGPGTGIAPFRAFLQERSASGAKGKNWLFFGEQRQAFDFLYQEELEAFAKQGTLNELSLAFSRDQEHKIYVQNRMQERAADLWRWLQEGAYIYVCGDAKRMAKDVHQTLIHIAQSQGGLSPEAATEFVEVTLAKTEKRYMKDVY